MCRSLWEGRIAIESNQGLDDSRRQGADRRIRIDPMYDGTERRRGRGRRSYEVDPATEHLLEPPGSNNYLNVQVALSRIGSEFGYLEADEDLGRRHVRQMIDAIRNRFEASDYIDHRERITHLSSAQADAIHIRCGDNPTAEHEYLSAVLVPGEPILAQYESLAHEKAARPLLDRLAKALGYKVNVRNISKTG